jgi:hypothetical protein
MRGKLGGKWVALVGACLIATKAFGQPVLVPATTTTIALPTTTGTKVIVSGVANLHTYVTALALVPLSGAQVWFTEANAGTSCATSPATLLGPVTMVGGDVIHWGSGFGAVLALSSGSDLCLTVSTATVGGSLAYGQY